MFVSEVKIAVRYYETDQMGIVHHSNYLRYFECGRHQALIDVGLPIHRIEELGMVMPVVSTVVKYKHPAKMGDILRVVSRIEELPRAKVVVLTEIFNQNDDLVALGEVIVGFLNSETKRPTRAPEYFVEAFAPHLT